mgnify:FL=1
MEEPSSLSIRSSQGRRASLLEQLFSKQAQDRGHLSSETNSAVQRAYNLQMHRSRSLQLDQTNLASIEMPKRRASLSQNFVPKTPLFVDNSPASIRDALFVASHEHHSHFDTASRIDTNVVLEPGCSKEDLALVVALKDGRMKDQARST